ncbi:MAG TPA: MBL fold metallo-hydrolase [Roseobacter sp.]|nr:MBL fold metallo-hydrolase [Roseobacter sp.]
MLQSRRQFLISSTATAGVVTMLPYAAQAAAHASNVFTAGSAEITVHPVDHASFVMETPLGVIYNDPVGDVANYSDFAKPDLILITHEHGDHFNVDTLNGVIGETTQIIANPAVYDMLPEALMAKASKVSNGETAKFKDILIEAIPAYNTTEDRKKFHPQGRDNGYVVNLPDFRVYISGDTEGIPEMRALENIDLAFVCMNLPFTMDADAAAAAVSEFKPSFVYPYHYRGRDGGTQDPAEFARKVASGVEVKMGDWY